MLRAGLPVLNTLEMLIGQTASKGMKTIIETIKKDLEAGNALSKCFEKHPKVFDTVVVNLIKAGEASGKLDILLQNNAYITQSFIDDVEKFLCKNENNLVCNNNNTEDQNNFDFNENALNLINVLKKHKELIATSNINLEETYILKAIISEPV